MSCLRCLLLTIGLGLPLLAAPAAAGPDAPPGTQDPDVEGLYARLEVHVTALSGISVYLDRGRVDKLERGDVLLLFPASGPQLRAVIRSVSKTSARAELDFPTTSLSPGDRGEVLLPKQRLAELEAPSSGKLEVESAPQQEGPGPTAPEALPEHPPWEGDLSGLDSQTPLLAPIEALEPEERARRMRGRAWFDYQTTTDNVGTKSSYDTLRTGFDLVFENAFGKGGELELDTELYNQSFDIDGSPSESNSSLRVNRLNWLVGGGRTAPTSFQVGRFFSRGMSEFGLIDGLEVRHRLAGGSALGFNLGALPVPGADLNTGDDVGVALFHHWTSSEDETLTLDTGYQKTWHKGQADRDLVVLTSNWRPGPRTFVYASAWVDIYGSEDLVKSSGPELTQLFASATWRSEGGHGLGLTLSQFRIPELLRQEFDPVTATELLDSKTTRAGLNGWRAIGEGLELRGRVDRWQDEETTGGRVEAGISARDRLWDGGSVELVLFNDENKFSSGPGLRVSASKSLAKSWLRLSYETAETKNSGFNGAQETLGRDVLRASWDLSLGSTWGLSLNAESRSGDAEDATTLGFVLEKRFR